MPKISNIITALSVAAFLLPFSSLAQGIPMLPPVQSSTASAVCSASAVGKILTWDGATAIKCQAGIIVDASGNVGIGTATPHAKLDVDGGIKIGMDATECLPAKAGTFRYTGAQMQFCNGADWVNAFPGSGPEWKSDEFYEDTEGSYVGANCPTGQVMTGIWTENVGMGGHNNWYILCK